MNAMSRNLPRPLDVGGAECVVGDAREAVRDLLAVADGVPSSPVRPFGSRAGAQPPDDFIDETDLGSGEHGNVDVGRGDEARPVRACFNIDAACFEQRIERFVEPDGIGAVRSLDVRAAGDGAAKPVIGGEIAEVQRPGKRGRVERRTLATRRDDVQHESAETLDGGGVLSGDEAGGHGALLTQDGLTRE